MNPLFETTRVPPTRQGWYFWKLTRWVRVFVESAEEAARLGGEWLAQDIGLPSGPASGPAVRG